MARNPFNIRTGSHTPVLIKLLSITGGDVAEFGMGMYSTPLLHYMCSPKKRNLYSFDNNIDYVNLFNLWEYQDYYHKIIIVKDWDEIMIDNFWSVVFIDHAPAERRKEEARKLCNSSLFVVLHDSSWKHDRYYHYKEIFPLFKYRYDYTEIKHNTTVLSNFYDLRGFSC